MSEDVSTVGDILSTDAEHRVVYGWASVISEDGKPVEDLQGDIIKSSELVYATTEFMKSARDAKHMHAGAPVGQVVHSFPFTADIAKSLGLESNREGWIVGVYVADDTVWKSVKDGTLSAFSIGGNAQRVNI
jgi:hypothetical protein